MKRATVLLLLSVSILYAQPGGVIGAELWLKANAGVTGDPVSKWNDQSGNGRNALQSNSDRQPDYKESDVNFNPSFYYTNHFLDVPYAQELNDKSLTVFAVVDAGGGSGYRSPWTTRNGSPIEGHILYRKPDNTYSYWNGTGSSWSRLNTSVSPSGEYEIITTTSVEASSSTINKNVYLQGKNIGNANGITFSPNTQRVFRIGKGATERSDGLYAWNGDISEIIVYSKEVTSSQRNRVESYLAIKYGLTLDQSGGGQNYTDSSSSVVWSASANSGFGNDIAGLGRDDSSVLHQKVSKSINSDAVVTMATSSDFTFANADGSRASVGEDKSFVVWSNDNGSTAWRTTGAPAGGKILTRKWKMQKSGTPGKVNIEIDVDDSDFDIENFIGTLYFVKGSDLSTATPQPMIDDGDGKWHIENVDFSSGEEFSFVIHPTDNSAEMIINEILYRQFSTGTANEEFVEFYVTKSGNINAYVVTDQESATHNYVFKDREVSAGDYVVLHVGAGSDSSVGGVHHFYMNRTAIFNNDGDDINLFKPSSSDTTSVSGETLDVIPFDYVAFDDGSAVDEKLTSAGGVTVVWSDNLVHRQELAGASKGQSISLTPNGVDSNRPGCWELTTSGNASGNGCANYLPTRDTESSSSLTYSIGKDNNGLPNMSITKSSIVISDPVNGTSTPKRIPGAIIRYCFRVDNTGDGDAQNVKIDDSLSGDGRESLTYKNSGFVVQNITSSCNCQSIINTSGTISNTDVTIEIGELKGTSDPSKQRACAYIEVAIE